ncbi:MAG TPA: branched-chain amino acid ABC transporter permease [Burkholderiaceae bacterium]|jgi:branched-chain amino acid transport system permease protein|nr:branched-chain amino acid ABC transporter permease [Burkholderiaceae bacterium]
MLNPTRVLLAVALVALIAFPLTGGGIFYIQLLTKVMILAIFAMSLDLLVGYTGLVSLGHAAFYGLAAYTLVIVQPGYDPMSILISLPAALAVCAIFALVTGALVLRTRGIYFIMVTLAFAQMVYFVFHDTPLGGGSDGVFINARPLVGWGEWRLLDLNDRTTLYFVVMALMVGVYLLLRRILDSNFGRALQGIRVNEHRMRAIGFPVFRYQLGAYVLAGVLAGLAGYLSALQFLFVNPEIISWHQSGAVLMMLILGGMGTLSGPIVGAFVFVLLEEFFKDDTVFGAFAKHWQLMMGGLIVLVACFLPRGLIGLVQRRRELGEAKHDG